MTSGDSGLLRQGTVSGVSQCQYRKMSLRFQGGVFDFGGVGGGLE
jgi:hypothetical protein